MDKKDKDGDGQPSSPVTKHSKPLSFDEKRAHLAAGYENAQSVVRLLETKAAVVVGGVPIALGIVAAVFNWLIESVMWSTVVEIAGIGIPTMFAVLMIIFALGLCASSWMTVSVAFGAIKPRCAGAAKPSVLFPYHTDEFADRVAVFIQNPTQADAIEDYERQVNRMSEIVQQKFDSVNEAIGHLKTLLLCGAVSLFIMTIMALVCAAIVGVDHITTSGT